MRIYVIGDRLFSLHHIFCDDFRFQFYFYLYKSNLRKHKYSAEVSIHLGASIVY